MTSHPTELGSSDSPLRGTWVRNTRIDYVGYISHVERRVNQRVKLWIVYPPGILPDGTRIKTWSAGCAYVDEVKKLKRKRAEVWPLKQ